MSQWQVLIDAKIGRGQRLHDAALDDVMADQVPRDVDLLLCCARRRVQLEKSAVVCRPETAAQRQQQGLLMASS